MSLEKILLLAKAKKTIKIEDGKTEDLTITTKKSYADTLREVVEKYPGAMIEPLSIYQAEGQETRNISFRIRMNNRKAQS